MWLVFAMVHALLGEKSVHILSIAFANMGSINKRGHYLGPAHRFVSTDGSISPKEISEKGDGAKAEINET